MEQPIVYYTPAIGPSGITFYRGSQYPGWTDNLFVAGMGASSYGGSKSAAAP